MNKLINITLTLTALLLAPLAALHAADAPKKSDKPNRLAKPMRWLACG